MSDSSSFKPIETRYKGYRFRSRLEARWAIFFDTIGVEYRYELEGFTLSNGTRYLPDFYIPHFDVWIEIKPTTPTYEEREKAVQLAIDLGKDTYVSLFAGDVWSSVQGYAYLAFPYKTQEDVLRHADAADLFWLSTEECISRNQHVAYGFDLHRGYVWSEIVWSECDTCHSVGLLSLIASTNHKQKDCTGSFNLENTRLLAAYEAARSARF